MESMHSLLGGAC